MSNYGFCPVAAATDAYLDDCAAHQAAIDAMVEDEGDDLGAALIEAVDKFGLQEFLIEIFSTSAQRRAAALGEFERLAVAALDNHVGAFIRRKDAE